MNAGNDHQISHPEVPQPDSGLSPVLLSKAGLCQNCGPDHSMDVSPEYRGE